MNVIVMEEKIGELLFSSSCVAVFLLSRPSSLKSEFSDAVRADFHDVHRLSISWYGHVVRAAKTLCQKHSSRVFRIFK